MFMGGRWRMGTTEVGMKKCRFSLVELLVVISMLSLLASLLSPHLKSSLAHSASINCRKNIKNQLVGTALYLQDHDDRFWEYRLPASRKKLDNPGPVYLNDDVLRGESFEECSRQKSGNPYSSTGRWGNYQAILVFYSGGHGSYQCPSYGGESYDVLFKYSYSFSKAYDHHHLGAFRASPSQLGAILDNRQTSYVDITSRAYQIVARHEGGVNLGYLDGHVDNLLPDELNHLSAQWDILGMTPHGNHGTGGPTLTPSTQSWNKIGGTYTVGGQDKVDDSGRVHVPQ